MKEKTLISKARLDGAVDLTILLIDALLVTAFVSDIITGKSSVVTKIFVVEAFAMAVIGFVMIMRAGRYTDEESGDKNV